MKCFMFYSFSSHTFFLLGALSNFHIILYILLNMQIPTVLYKLTPYSANLLFSSDNSHQPARQTFHESQSTQA